MALLAASGAAPAFVRPAFAANVSVKIAAVPFDSTAQPYYADQMGMFKKVGLIAELDSFTTNGAVIAASVAGGSIDIGVSNFVSLASAHVKKLPFVVIAPAALYSSKAPADALVVPLSSMIKTAKDFNGKTIAVSGVRNIAEFAPRAWIDKNGGDSAQVKFLEIPPAEQVAALAQGRADAASVSEPFIAAFNGVARVFCHAYDAIAPTFMISGYFTTLEWARSNLDTVHKFQEAMRESAQWANAHQERSLEILAKAAKLEPSRLSTMFRAVYTDKLDPAMIQPMIDVAATYLNIPRFPADELIFRA
jgi:NitT/TauT family transport system substrate-binding protein